MELHRYLWQLSFTRDIRVRNSYQQSCAPSYLILTDACLLESCQRMVHTENYYTGPSIASLQLKEPL